MSKNWKAIIIIGIVIIAMIIGFIFISKAELDSYKVEYGDNPINQKESIEVIAKSEDIVDNSSEAPTASPTIAPTVKATSTPTLSSDFVPENTAAPIPELPKSNSDKVQVNTKMNINGYVYVSYKSDKKVKVMMDNKEQQEVYDLISDGQFHRFTLHLGDGDYKIRVVENTSGNSYRVIETVDFECNMISNRFPYLVPNSFVVYDNDMEVIQFGLELTKDAYTDEEKAHAIYDWIVRNISYDFSIVGELEVGYVPNPQETFDTKKGICSDFAVLFASLCRSQGIPCKVVLGYYVKSDYYHAWNEVLINGEYVIVDTSGDSQTEEYNFSRTEGYTKNKEH